MLQPDELKQLVHESAKKIAEIISEDEVHEKKFESLEHRQQKLQNEIEAQELESENKMYDGLKTCILALKECHNLPMSFDDVVQELNSCLSVINSAEVLSKFGDLLLSNVSWKSGLGISDNCMKALFLGAEHTFMKKEYENSEKAFLVLCSLDPSEFTYWIGLGHSAFHNKNYQQAINAYSIASALYPEDAWPHIWAANTFEEEKKNDYAKIAIDEALSIEKAKMPINHELVHSLEERLKGIKVH